ncbi:MAG: flagellar basal body P-ring protein FlgI, partial [Gammaproteobacteria bacterium]|nr:flagellar basal body P-ring protein FlgI [Gammaproteobacteria bacterium]NIR93570.1 flagellar basal body P-ring protein FlgI [Gammaproteobacteria bacterium]NIW46780.1 flagellar biosynthesis protein FlgA [Gammaproteobacteria bacterium]NIW98356.1 flagellar biosynthesis protein FlgA [Phycisphaerae bacterium]
TMESEDLRLRNVAAVMVTATIPPFIEQGETIDVTVSSIGDATSLQGGTLLLTPLSSPDG